MLLRITFDASLDEWRAVAKQFRADDLFFRPDVILRIAQEINAVLQMEENIRAINDQIPAPLPGYRRVNGIRGGDVLSWDVKQ